MKLTIKIIALCIAVIIATTVGVIFIKSKSIDNMPGSVIGPNPKSIPESQLPECIFRGDKFAESPCYSPPDARYL